MCEDHPGDWEPISAATIESIRASARRVNLMRVLSGCVPLSYAETGTTPPPHLSPASLQARQRRANILRAVLGVATDASLPGDTMDATEQT